MKSRLKISVMCILMSCFAGIAQGEMVDQIVAVVNQKVITLYQVQQAEKQFLAQKAFSSNETPEVRREKVLNFLVENELIRQNAEETGILVSDEELNAAIYDIKQRNKLVSDDQLKDIVRQEGNTWDEFLDNIREQIQIAKLINREVRSQINITEEEVEAYYQTHADSFAQSPSTVHIRHILLKVSENATESEIQAVSERAAQIVGQLRAGADFVTLARQYSEHPSSEAGGELGTFKQGELAAPFDIAFTMNQGEVSDPVRSEFGFHIIYVQEKVEGKESTFEKVKPSIQRRLFEEKSETLYQKWIERLKGSAYIETK